MNYSVEFEAYGIAIIPIITGIVAVLNKVGMSKKYSPLVALILGILFGVFYLDPTNILRGILYAIAASLGSMGLYSGAKHLIEVGGGKKE